MFFVLVPAFCLFSGGLWAQDRPRAVLVEGIRPVSGVPGFGPNNLPALYGVYRLPDQSPVRVFALDQPLLFNAGLWDSGGRRAFPWYVLRNREDGRVYALERQLTMNENLRDRSRWYFVFVFPGESPETGDDAFMTAFMERTVFFFGNARLYADLSFPASLSW